MKYAMYAIIGLLTIMVAILAYMNANKPPVILEERPVIEERQTTREVLFNESPVEERDYNFNPGDDPDDMEEEEEDPETTRLDQMMYAVSAVNLRAGPGTDFDRIGSLSANQQVHVIGQNKETNWYKIEHGDGFAYVSHNFLELVTDGGAVPADDNTGVNEPEIITEPETDEALIGETDTE